MDENQQSPVAGPTADVSRIDAILAKVAPDYAMRLRGLYSKWLNPEENSLKESERRELILAKLIPESFAEAENGQVIPKHTSQRGLAKILSEVFKRNVFPKHIQAEIKIGRKNGKTGLASFESNGGNGMIATEQAIQWWKDNKISPADGGLSTTNPHIEESKARKMAAEAEIAERENERQRRKFESEWMLTSAHEFAMSAVGTAAVTSVKDAIERILKNNLDEVLKRVVTDAALLQVLTNEIGPMFSEATDTWQTSFCNRLAELNTESKVNSEKEKGQMR